MQKTWDKFGLKWALESYDQKFGLSNNAYRASADIAFWLEPIKDNDVLMDVGSGTGISTTAMIGSNPDIAEIICIEPSEGIRVAKHKFSHEKLFETDNIPIIKSELGVSLSQEYVKHLMETKRRMERFREKVRFINLPAQEISDLVEVGSINKGYVDKIYCLSSFHWLANNEETGVTRPEYVADSLRGFCRALKRDGLLIFNESGLQFDFGEGIVSEEGEGYSGMKINNVHMLQQEFHKRFLDEFNRILKEMGFGDDSLIDPNGKADTYHFLFNERLLRAILEENGFRLKKMEKRSRYDPPATGVEALSYAHRGDNYLLTIMPKKPEGWDRFILTGGNMRYFNHADELKVLDSDKREGILHKAYAMALSKHSHLKNVPYGETFATFVAEKV